MTLPSPMVFFKDEPSTDLPLNSGTDETTEDETGEGRPAPRLRAAVKLRFDEESEGDDEESDRPHTEPQKPEDDVSFERPRVNNGDAQPLNHGDAHPADDAHDEFAAEILYRVLPGRVFQGRDDIYQTQFDATGSGAGDRTTDRGLTQRREKETQTRHNTAREERRIAFEDKIRSIFRNRPKTRKDSSMTISDLRETRPDETRISNGDNGIHTDAKNRSKSTLGRAGRRRRKRGRPIGKGIDSDQDTVWCSPLEGPLEENQATNAPRKRIKHRNPPPWRKERRGKERRRNDHQDNKSLAKTFRILTTVDWVFRICFRRCVGGHRSF